MNSFLVVAECRTADARVATAPTILHLCAIGHLDSVALLLSHRASADCRDEDGFSALHCASWANQHEVVALLVEHGAVVNAVHSSTGETPLHLAAKHGANETCALLIGSGAYLGAQDHAGATPLMCALEREHRDVARMVVTAAARGSSSGPNSLEALTDPLDGIAQEELLAACSASDAAHSCGDEAPSAHADLPAEFAQQAASMPLVLRRLLVDNVNPSYASLASLLRALRLGPTEHSLAIRARGRPSHELLLVRKRLLSLHVCAALRTAVDDVRRRSTKLDSVDGLAEHQLDLTLEVLVQIVGDEAVATLRALPSLFSESSGVASIERTEHSQWHEGEAGGTSGASGASASRRMADLQIQRMFVRRYTAAERPWFRLHFDTAALTANISLASDTQHCGGRLLALLGGELRTIDREEGEATVHPSSLLHGVTRMRGGGVRYSLIVFYW
jgi:hypothetical protein